MDWIYFSSHGVPITEPTLVLDRRGVPCAVICYVQYNGWSVWPISAEITISQVEGDYPGQFEQHWIHS